MISEQARQGFNQIFTRAAHASLALLRLAAMF